METHPKSPFYPRDVIAKRGGPSPPLLAFSTFIIPWRLSLHLGGLAFALYKPLYLNQGGEETEKDTKPYRKESSKRKSVLKLGEQKRRTLGQTY